MPVSGAVSHHELACRRGLNVGNLPFLTQQAAETASSRLQRDAQGQYALVSCCLPIPAVVKRPLIC